MSENNVNGIIGASVTTTGIIGATVAIGQYIINDYVITIAEAEGDYGYTMTITRGTDTQTVTLYGLTPEQYNTMIGYLEQAQAAAQAASGSANDAADYMGVAVQMANNATSAASRASSSANTSSNYASQAQQSANSAASAKTDAVAAKTDAQNAAQNAASSRDAAQTAAANARAAQTAAEAAQTAAEAAQSAAEAAQTTAQAAETNTQTYAGQAQQNATNAAQSAASAAHTLTQVQNEGASQIAAIDAEGQRVIDSIPSDYTQMEEDVTDLKSQSGNNVYNFTDSMSKTSGTHNGVTFTWSGDQCTVSGTASGQAYNNFYVDRTNMAGMKAGGSYYLDFAGVDVYVAIYKYNAAGAASLFLNDAYSSQWFTIPSDAVGLIIRLSVKNGAKPNETVRPIIYNRLPLDIMAQRVDKLESESNLGVMASEALYDTPLNLEFEQGGLVAGGSGEEFPSGSYIRTAEYFEISKYAQLSIVCNNDYEGYCNAYTLSGGVYTREATYNVVKNTTTVVPYTAGYYYRLSMRHPDQSAISPSDAANISIGTNSLFVMSDNNYTDEAKHTVDNVANVYGHDMISLDYEVVPFTLPSVLTTNKAWSDIIIIDNQIWFFVQSTGEDHATADGYIYVYDMTTWQLVKTITHDFGHVNTCSYDAVNDTLLIGNLPGSTQYPAALYIFYGVSDWSDGDTIRFANTDKTIIDLSGWTDLSRVSACWGERTGDSRRIVYVALRYFHPYAKIILGMGTNQLDYGTYAAADADKYNGTFNVLITTDTSGEFPNETDGVWQGCDYINGTVVTCNGDMYITAVNRWHYNAANVLKRLMIAFPYYDGDGELTSTVRNFPEGIAYNPADDYVYMGYYYSSTWHLIRFRM